MVAARTLRIAPRAAGTARPVLAAIRAFFAERGLVEVDTPALQQSPGLEPHLHAFATAHDPGDGRSRRYLHTSPEFAMKKLLVGGMPRIFQLAHGFRNGERGAAHHPEFTMLEWYRAGAYIATSWPIARRCCARARGGRRPGICLARAAPPIRAGLAASSVADAFRRHCGIDLLATCARPGDPEPRSLAAEARPIGIAPHDGDNWEDLFFRIFLEKIEPQLGIGAPTILYDYPVAMAALARASPTIRASPSASSSMCAASNSPTPSAS